MNSIKNIIKQNILNYIFIIFTLFLSLRYILPYKLDFNLFIYIILINISIIILLDSNKINIEEN